MSSPPPAPSPAGDPADEVALLQRLVESIRAETAAAARVHATLIRQRAEVMRVALARATRSGSRASRERELPVRSVALEIAIATRASDLTVQRELSDAFTLTEKFAATVVALEEGRIGPRHAHAILDTGTALEDDAARAGWEKVVLDRAERDSPARVRAFARELAESVHPAGMNVRHVRAAASRGVSVRDLADGMAELSVILPATVAYGIRDRLRRQAAAIRAAASESAAPGSGASSSGPSGSAAAVRAAALESGASGYALGGELISGAGQSAVPDTTDTRISATTDAGPAEAPAAVDTRTLAQIGADLCADLLLTGAPAVDPTTEDRCPGGLAAIQAHVQVTVPVLTLLGHHDAGATVEGAYPIDPETARQLAAQAPGWDRVLTHPITGTVLEVDRYTPTTAQRRYLAARDRHCRAPGCRAPISRCQLDHNHEAQHGGATRLTNLCNLCVRHHTPKTEEPWTVTQDPDGTLHFRSPLGQHRVEKAPPRVVFVPTVENPPF